MRDSLLQAERAMADWEDLNDQHIARAGGDAGVLLKNKESDLPGIQSAWDNYVFHRDRVGMYAAIIQAEEAARVLLWGTRGSFDEQD